jgi:F-type H+-transporting ATPase subunit a
MEEVFPHVAFYLFGIPVRDTVVSTWVMIAITLGIVWVIRKRLPTALVMVIEFFESTISDVMPGLDVQPYLPFLGALGIFIAMANSIGVVPLLQTPTKDINTPLALALSVFFAVHIFGFQQKGWGYLKELASPMIILDLIGQASRTMSLSLRLFGNIIAGEIIVAVIYRLFKPVVPLLMVALSLFTGLLQAYIFVVLATGAVAASVTPKEDGLDASASEETAADALISDDRVPRSVVEG